MARTIEQELAALAQEENQLLVNITGGAANPKKKYPSERAATDALAGIGSALLGNIKKRRQEILQKGIKTL